MEEILASIRRIIADDEAKPPVAAAAPTVAAPKSEPAKAAAPAAKAPAMSTQPSAPPAAKAAPPPPAPPPPAPPAADEGNSQDDIDALLAGLDGSTTEDDVRSAPPEAAPPEEEEVFELTDEMALPDPAPAFPPLESDVVFAEASRRERAPEPEPSWDEALTEAAPPPPVSHAAPPQAQMLSHSTVAAVESAFNSLAHTVLSNNARTLEDLVKEMLRPMLKSWLDDNLPQMVERIVKAEIERVSRGR